MPFSDDDEPRYGRTRHSVFAGSALASAFALGSAQYLSIRRSLVPSGSGQILCVTKAWVGRLQTTCAA